MHSRLLFFLLSLLMFEPGHTSDIAVVRPPLVMADINRVIHAGTAARIRMGLSREGRPVEAWYFPGTSQERALIIGGVHGSELSSTEVAGALIRQLREQEKPYYSVIVIPCLFPDNAARAGMQPQELGSVKNIGRYTHVAATDPNRQMPTPAHAFDAATGLDHIGRNIEWENQLLLDLIARFRPSRIASLHAIRNTGYGGIYADPRTDHLGLALGYASDSSLAVDMARHAQEAGANVKGNKLHIKPTALYYKDPAPVLPGQWQARNMTGTALRGGRGSGVSLGTWGTTAIAWESDSTLNRDAMRVLTIEFPGARRPDDYTNASDMALCNQQVLAFAGALYHIFLGPYYTEKPPFEIVS